MEKHILNLKSNIKHYRLAMKFSQEKLAAESGLTPQTINHIENSTSAPKTQSVLQIAKALNIHPQYLWYDNMPEYPALPSYDEELLKIHEYKPTDKSPSVYYIIHDMESYEREYGRGQNCKLEPFAYSMSNPRMGNISLYGIRVMKRFPRHNETPVIATFLDVSRNRGVVQTLVDTFNERDVSICDLFGVLVDLKYGQASIL